MTVACRVVLLAGEGESTNIVYHALAAELPIDAVIIEPRTSKLALAKRRVKKLGLVRVAGQIVFQGLVVPMLRRSCAGRVREIKQTYALDDRPLPAGIVSHVPTANSEECIALLRELRPRVVVVNGTRILSERVLASTDAIFINMHAGITPLYRGVHGGYWALASGDPANAGVTVHLVDKGIDTGSILAQAPIAPSPSDSFVTYTLLQLAAGLPLLKRCVADALEGRVERIPPPPGKSRLWSHPTIWQYAYARLTRGVR